VSLGLYEKALSDLDQAIQLNPNYLWAVSSRGEAFRTLGDDKKALADFKLAVGSSASKRPWREYLGQIWDAILRLFGRSST